MRAQRREIDLAVEGEASPGRSSGHGRRSRAIRWRVAAVEHDVDLAVRQPAASARPRPRAGAGAAGLGDARAALPHPHAQMRRRRRRSTNSTLVRAGNSGWCLDPRAQLATGAASASSTNSTQCGLPTDTAAASHAIDAVDVERERIGVDGLRQRNSRQSKRGAPISTVTSPVRRHRCRRAARPACRAARVACRSLPSADARHSARRCRSFPPRRHRH